MDGERFDRLTRMLAAGASRRRALQGLGLALVGGSALAGVSRVEAAAGGNGHGGQGGNSACAHFCKQAFPPGAARGQCVSDAARGAADSLCVQCGADITRLCAGSCCASGETCIGGGTDTAGTVIPGPLCCASGQVCGGPTADVQICCPSGQSCTGTIPNQQCA